MNSVYDFGSGPGGPMISGKWMNKRTGEIINVRDCLMDGDNMVLSTSKGMMDFSSFSNNYIQASDEVYDTSGKVIKTEAMNMEEIADTIKEEKPVIKFNNNSSVQNNVESKSQSVSNINNFDLIDKIFKKIESKPNVNLNIEWAGFPKKELLMLIEYFDVKSEDIAKYIGKYLINEQLLNDVLNNFISDKLNSKK